MDKQQVMVSTLMRKQVEQELGLDEQGLVSALVVENDIHSEARFHIPCRIR
jgi:hypothetical protein